MTWTTFSPFTGVFISSSVCSSSVFLIVPVLLCAESVYFCVCWPVQQIFSYLFCVISLIFYLNLPFAAHLFSFLYFSSSSCPSLQPLPPTLFFIAFLPTFLLPFLSMSAPTPPCRSLCHLSSPAASPLCSRSIESLPDNQKYRQLQKELSQVLTQRQIFID